MDLEKSKILVWDAIAEGQRSADGLLRRPLHPQPGPRAGRDRGLQRHVPGPLRGEAGAPKGGGGAATDVFVCW